MYTINKCKIKDKIEYEKHYSGRYGAPGIKRAPRTKKTPEEMKKQNEWRRKRDLTRTIDYNFGESDLHTTLTYTKEERPTREEAYKIIRWVRDKLRKIYKKYGWEFKYIITTEVGKRGAVHHHMIISAHSNDKTNTSKEINKLWKKGRAFFVHLDDTGDYKALAEYIIKGAGETEEGKVEKLSYMASRNLIKPPVIRKQVKAKRWREEPRIPKGYYLVKDSLINGWNKFTGLPYQYYTIKKIKRGDDDGKDMGS